MADVYYVMVDVRKMYQVGKGKQDEKLWERGFGFFKHFLKWAE